MRLAIHQTAGVLHDPDANLDALARTARRAADAGAEVLILPEMWLTGYNIGAAVRELAQTTDGPAADRVGAIAGESGLAILYGYPERAGDEVYNAARLVGRDGTPLANMRKAHLYGDEERRLFAPGDTGLPVVPIGGLRVGILICYDVEFPEAVRTAALRGADLVAVPTALFRPYDFVATHVVPVRAWENGLFVAYANRCGEEGELGYVGRSRICAPDGSILAGAGEEDTLLLADIEPEAFADLTSRDNPYLRDRRPALYDALTGGDAG